MNPMISQASLAEALRNGAYTGDSSGYGVANGPPFVGIDSAGNAVPMYGHGVSTVTSMPGRWSEANLNQMLTMRLGWNIEPCPFRKIVPVKLNDSRVAVFICTGDEALIVEDDAGLYPSDALVTQIRLLREATCSGTTGNAAMAASR